MNPRKSESESLLAGKEPCGTTGNEPEKVDRVLVFKQAAKKSRAGAPPRHPEGGRA